jgi:hypothetical protein
MAREMAGDLMYDFYGNRAYQFHWEDLMAKPKQQCAMQVLTLDYLIEGNVDLDDELVSLLEGWSNYYDDQYIIKVASARIQPTGNLTTPAFSVSQWILSQRGGLVAFIPRDETGTQALLKTARGETFSFRAAMYAGPYLIRASLAVENPFEEWAFIHARDVRIDCQLPKAQLDGFTVPWAVLNTELIQGCCPA